MENISFEEIGVDRLGEYDKIPFTYYTNQKYDIKTVLKSYMKAWFNIKKKYYNSVDFTTEDSIDF